MRRYLLALTACLCATAALAGGPTDMTDAERLAFRAEVKAYLLENPDVLVEAMTVLQAREDAAAAQNDLTLVKTNADALFTNASDWVGGNPNGDITVVEFMDYRCGYCRKAHDEVNELVKSDGNIRYIVKEFPILGEGSILSSQFAIAVRIIHGDDIYSKVRTALITLRGDATVETLSRVATDMGLDPAPILAKMKTDAVNAIIQANHDLANAMNITGTPTFVIDSGMVRGYVPLDGMRDLVKDARAG